MKKENVQWHEAVEKKTHDTELILDNVKGATLTDCYVGHDDALVMVYDNGYVVRLSGGFEKEVYTDVLVRQVRYMTLRQAQCTNVNVSEEDTQRDARKDVY